MEFSRSLVDGSTEINIADHAIFLCVPSRSSWRNGIGTSLGEFPGATNSLIARWCVSSVPEFVVAASICIQIKRVMCTKFLAQVPPRPHLTQPLQRLLTRRAASMVKLSLCHPGVATHPFEVAATAMLPLSLQPGYDYFDGEVGVLRPF